MRRRWRRSRTRGTQLCPRPALQLLCQSYDILLRASSRVPEAARVASNLQMLNSRPVAEFHGISGTKLCFLRLRINGGNVFAYGVVQKASSRAMARQVR